MRVTLRRRLIAMHQRREELKNANRRPRDTRLGRSERAEILRKTAGKCHICGGAIHGSWSADHVLAHSAGGDHAADNYLAAHHTCNHYRWDYLPEEFELILKLGVWARTQVERGTAVGRDIERGYSDHEVRLMARRSRAPRSGGA